MRDDVRRTIRIIQIDEMLRGGNYVKIDDLLFKFGVNQRTIERDFQRLRDDMDAPLEYDKARKMYHYSDPMYSVPNILLTEGDLFTVSTVLPLMEQYKNTPLENSFRHIIEKITNMLPDTVSVDTSFLNKDVSFIKDPLPKIEERVFNDIFKAIKTRTTINFEYRNIGSRDFKSRKINAYHVLCQKGSWYVLGFDHGAEDVRIFAMSRIKDISFTNTVFPIPKDFNLQDHIDLNFGIWNNPEKPVEYELLFSSKIANYINERQWHDNQTLIQNDDGSVLLKFKSNQKEMVFSWVLSFGSSVTVLKPSELIEKIVEENKNLLKKYK